MNPARNAKVNGGQRWNRTTDTGIFNPLCYRPVPSTLNSLWLGPSFGTIQNLAPTRMRAMASALMLFILNIIGLGLGPFLVGVLSDLLSGTFGIDSLRYAILIATVAYFWAGAHFVMAGKTIRQDLEAAQRAADAA